MKARTFSFTVLSVLTIAAMLTFVSCDNDDSSGNSFTYDGTTYQITDGYLAYRGETNGSYKFLIAGVSPSIDYEALTGTGELFLIDIYTPSTKLVAGTYTYLQGGGDPHTFGNLTILLNFEMEIDEGDIYMAEAGTVTITEVSYCTISLNFEVTFDDGKTATGTWSGPVTTLFDF
jgi:hypothetical protein